MVVAGCSGGGKLVDNPGADPDAQDPNGPFIQIPDLGQSGGTPTSDSDRPLPTETLDMKVAFEKGRKETYVITNETTTQTRGMDEGPLVTTDSFLNARQEVTVMKSSGNVRSTQRTCSRESTATRSCKSRQTA